MHSERPMQLLCTVESDQNQGVLCSTFCVCKTWGNAMHLLTDRSISVT